MDDQEAMVMDGGQGDDGGGGGGSNGNGETNGSMHTLHALDTNGQPQQGHTNGIVCPSSGETMHVQNVITTVMSTSNGDHHSGEDQRDSPEIQTSGYSTTTTMVTTMPISQTAATISEAVDTSHIKIEPQEHMNVIIKQEVMGTGEWFGRWLSVGL